MEMAPKVKKAGRKSSAVAKFSTPLVGKLIEGLGAAALEGVKKNRNATGKWLEKLKLSVLRKLQGASKVCFLSDNQNAEVLKGEIEKLREKIKKQTSSVKESALKSLKSVKLSELSKTSRTAGYKPGKFSNKVEKIKEQFGKVATELESASQVLQERLKNLTSTVAHIQNNWGGKSAAGGAGAGAGAGAGGGAGAGAAPAKRGPGRPSKAAKLAAAASPDAALSSVHKHLSVA